jgi:hypothetical protein
MAKRSASPFRLSYGNNTTGVAHNVWITARGVLLKGLVYRNNGHIADEVSTQHPQWDRIPPVYTSVGDTEARFTIPLLNSRATVRPEHRICPILDTFAV